MRLFSGPSASGTLYPPEIQRASAITSDGLVFYFDILRNLSARPEDLVRLRIIPGKIEVESGHSFPALIDLYPSLGGTVSGPNNVSDLSSLQGLQRPGAGTPAASASIEAHVRSQRMA